MTKKASSEAHFIAPDAYPQLMSSRAAAQAMKVLRSAETEVKAQVAMEAHVPPMRAAILQYVDELEHAAGDMLMVFEKVHEIRGFAETAGLITTGRIADILCRYMDDMYRIKKPLDTMIVTLHVSAIARAARAEDDDLKMGEVVAGELAALVAQRLADASR
ncbi:MAG: hypothetical protein H0U98_10425 [Alphaproteobacteria bacterium]|nr:hypothetical protein [Alphaproteobacteria bacterium]